MVGAFAGERTRRIYSFVSPVVRLKMNPIERYYRDVLELSTIFTDKKRATISRSPKAQLPITQINCTSEWQIVRHIVKRRGVWIGYFLSLYCQHIPRVMLRFCLLALA